jgi:polyisoprenoid-binding protein YceI
MKHLMAGLLVVAAVAMSACSAATPSPTPVADPPTLRPTTAALTPAPTSAPTQVAQPAPTATQATATKPQPTTPPTAAQAPQSGTTATLVLDGQENQAGFRAREQLLGNNLPSEAIGTTKNVRGRIVLSPTGEPIPEQSQVTVDLSTLQSDERRRDNFIKQNTLQTDRFPQATFTAKDIEGLAMPLPTSGEASFRLSGDLAVHGVTRPVTWQVTATFTPSGVAGNATTQVRMTDFGMTPPRVGPVVGIEDQLTLELTFAAARDA